METLAGAEITVRVLLSVLVVVLSMVSPMED